MRRIITFTLTTLDGYIDEPHTWPSRSTGGAFEAYVLELTQRADALLFGRRTYEAMAQAWPHRGGDPFADHVNAITKYVVASEPVDTAAWTPAVVVAGTDLLDEVRRLKHADGSNILTWGTGRLTDALAAAGLLDEYRLCVSPYVKGGGEPLFRPQSADTLELTDTTVLPSGDLMCAYRPSSATEA